MAPHNTGSKRLKCRRYHLRKRKAEQLAELLPSLMTARTFTEDDVVKRKADGDSLIDWSALHPELNPSLACKASLPEKRAARKRTQIAELLSWATELLPQGGTAVDFCAGSGHVGLVLAAIRPDAVVHIVEKKSQHCMLAQERADKALLKNVIVSCCQLSDFTAPFDVGMGLHACGAATDLIHSLCLSACAAYVLAPCCYGAIAKALDAYRLDYVDHNANCSMVHIGYHQLPPCMPEEEAWVLKNHGTWEGLERQTCSEAAALEEARLREACVYRARVKAADDLQQRREAAAPLSRTVHALDALLFDLAEACGEEGRRQLLRHQLRIDELKRSHWGCGVSFPRSCFFRQNVQDLEMYSVLAGTADATMWASEDTFSVSKEHFARRCMSAIDLDRTLAAQDLGYIASVVSMCDGDTDKAGQKNQLLIGRFCL